MVSWHDIQFALNCTAENLYIILPVFLLSAAAAFLVGLAVIGRVKNAVIRLLPLIFAELVLFLIVFPYLTRWIGIGSFTWGFWYEGGWDFYLPITAMVGVLIGYLPGRVFKEKKVQEK